MALLGDRHGIEQQTLDENGCRPASPKAQSHSNSQRHLQAKGGNSPQGHRAFHATQKNITKRAKAHSAGIWGAKSPTPPLTQKCGGRRNTAKATGTSSLSSFLLACLLPLGIARPGPGRMCVVSAAELRPASPNPNPTDRRVLCRTKNPFS